MIDQRVLRSLVRFPGRGHQSDFIYLSKLGERIVHGIRTNDIAATTAVVEEPVYRMGQTILFAVIGEVPEGLLELAEARAKNCCRSGRSNYFVLDGDRFALSRRDCELERNPVPARLQGCFGLGLGRSSYRIGSGVGFSWRLGQIKTRLTTIAREIIRYRLWCR